MLTRAKSFTIELGRSLEVLEDPLTSSLAASSLWNWEGRVRSRYISLGNSRYLRNLSSSASLSLSSVAESGGRKEYLCEARPWRDSRMLSASPFSLWTMARADLVRLGVAGPGRSGARASHSEAARVKQTSWERGCGHSEGTTTRSHASVAAHELDYLVFNK